MAAGSLEGLTEILVLLSWGLSGYPAVRVEPGGETMAILPMGWTAMAACRGSEGALFFAPDVSERKEERLERELAAKRICTSCPVREECLTNAIDHRESHGIWGGLNEVERRSLLRR
jgi:WhiB family redox-sensing transcriptional regulator